MILAFGCSITHGADLVYPNQHKDNVKYSYPNLIADALGVECKNLAVCGASNEAIFHKTLDVLKTSSPKLTAVIVGWTSDVREYWQADSREWFFIPSWCATKKIGVELKYFKDYTDSDINLHPRLCADEEQYLEPLATMYDYLMRYKFDQEEYKIKKYNYILSIRDYCRLHNVKLIETCCLSNIPGIINLDEFGTWRQGLGHPTQEDHKQIAQQILLKYER
jgi:hypothetical protein